jgi:hypothetical protein
MGNNMARLVYFLGENKRLLPLLQERFVPIGCHVFHREEMEA